jgi:hypothetical protein
MKLRRYKRVAFAALVATTAGLALAVSGGAAGGDNQTVRWDIVSINFAAGTISAGGHASARAEDNSKITLRGFGTFVPGESDEVTGGGTWTTFSPTGATTGSGTYRVTRLVSWVLAPGALPPLTDLIGNPAESAAGLATLRIRFSDGSKGLLIVSCHIVGTPDSVFEGITASKGFVHYWNREAPPAPPGDANRTLFHVSTGDDDDD